jgi:hypothetical protein
MPPEIRLSGIDFTGPFPRSRLAFAAVMSWSLGLVKPHQSTEIRDQLRAEKDECSDLR